MSIRFASRLPLPISFVVAFSLLFEPIHLAAHASHSTPVSFSHTDLGPEYVMEAIARENLKTITSLEGASKAPDALEQGTFKKSYEMLLDTLNDQLNLSYKEKRRITFMLFSHYERRHPFATNTVLDPTSWQDLELLCGPKSDVRHYIAAKIDRAQTEAGRVMFFKKIIEPTSDIPTLQTNQGIIRELYANERLFRKLEKQIARLRDAEGAVLSLWNSDFFYDAVKQDQLHIPRAEKLSRYINTTPGLVEMNAYSRLFANTTNHLAMVACAVLVPWLGVRKATGFDLFNAVGSVTGHPAWGDKFLNNVNFLEAGAYLSFIGFMYGSYRWFAETTKVNANEHIVLGITTGYPALFFPDYFRYVVNFRKCIQTKLMHTARYIDALREISKITRSNEMLAQQFPALANLEEELDDLCQKSPDFGQFVGLLKTKTFKGKEASFFSWYGRVNVAYQLLHGVKNNLIHPMMVVGELDAFLSCTRLVKELESKNDPICFATYLKDSDQPSVTITDFWNPSVIGRKAVTNSLIIGGKDNPKNIIVTGPNAGGKSTTMKGLLVNVVLAQTFGIATARSFVFTPFAKIITYLNITDDIAAGKSHFKAGACRARELIKTTQSVSEKEFSLTAVDEVFNGTTFYEGQAAAYALIEQLSTFPHNICVTITHFPQVPRLEFEYPHVFANYKVTVSFGPDGSMNYPYKIERGISEQNIALEILKIEGFNDTFLTKATEILAQNPETKGKA